MIVNSFLIVMKKTVLPLLLFFSFIIISSCSSLIDAQALPLTPKSAGSKSAVTGFIMTQNQFYNGDQRFAHYIPAKYSNTEITGEVPPSNLCLVESNPQSTLVNYYSNIWNFSSSESSSIRAYLTGLPKVRNNLHFTFSATWEASGRFPVITGEWLLPRPSLLPYAFNESCNVTALWARHVVATRNLPASCENTLLPAIKDDALAHPTCTLMSSMGLSYLYTMCFTIVNGDNQRSLLEFYYCNEGEKGVELICDAAKKWKASGDPNHPPVYLTGSDGFPVAGRADQADGGSAGAQAFQLMLFVVLFSLVVFLF